MTYTFKALIIATLGTIALTAQTVSAPAMGSDREPDTTNMIERNAPMPVYPAQKNAVIRFETIVGYNDYTGNQTFADQR